MRQGRGTGPVAARGNGTRVWSPLLFLLGVSGCGTDKYVPPAARRSRRGSWMRAGIAFARSTIPPETMPTAPRQRPNEYLPGLPTRNRDASPAWGALPVRIARRTWLCWSRRGARVFWRNAGATPRACRAAASCRRVVLGPGLLRPTHPFPPLERSRTDGRMTGSGLQGPCRERGVRMRSNSASRGAPAEAGSGSGTSEGTTRV